MDGAVAAAIAGQDPVAITAIPTGAGLLGASAYYSRVRKFAGVELADEVLQEGGSYEALPDATPTEAVQDFARRLASRLQHQEELEKGRVPLSHDWYFLHVDRQIPRGMVIRATWEGTDEFARFLRDRGWAVEMEARLPDGRRADLLATRDGEQLWIEVKGVIYALNPAIVREIAERFPAPSDAPAGVSIRRALYLPTPPLAVSADALNDFRENQLELWYADDRHPERFVKAV